MKILKRTLEKISQTESVKKKVNILTAWHDTRWYEAENFVTWYTNKFIMEVHKLTFELKFK